MREMLRSRARKITFNPNTQRYLILTSCFFRIFFHLYCFHIMLSLSNVTIKAFAYAIEYSWKQYLKSLHKVHIKALLNTFPTVGHCRVLCFCFINITAMDSIIEVCVYVCFGPSPKIPYSLLWFYPPCLSPSLECEK